MMQNKYTVINKFNDTPEFVRHDHTDQYNVLLTDFDKNIDLFIKRLKNETKALSDSAQMESFQSIAKYERELKFFKNNILKINMFKKSHYNELLVDKLPSQQFMLEALTRINRYLENPQDENNVEQLKVLSQLIPDFNLLYGIWLQFEGSVLLAHIFAALALLCDFVAQESDSLTMDKIIITCYSYFILKAGLGFALSSERNRLLHNASEKVKSFLNNKSVLFSPPKPTEPKTNQDEDEDENTDSYCMLS